MAVADPGRTVAGREIVHRLVGQGAYHDVEQRHVHQLTGAGTLALVKSRLDADDRVETCKDVGIGNADLLRRTVRIASQVHDAAHTLDDEVVSRPAGIRAILAEPRDRAIDQTGIDGPQAFVIEAVFFKPPDLEILDQHVRIAHQLDYRLPPLLGLKIGLDGGLSPIGGVKIGGITRTIGSLYERRSPLPRIVAIGAFDLDDLCPQIGQHLPGPRSGQYAREFDDLYARERCFLHDRGILFAAKIEIPAGLRNRLRAVPISPGGSRHRSACRWPSALRPGLSLRREARKSGRCRWRAVHRFRP